jgi:hypothetical protein
MLQLTDCVRTSFTLHAECASQQSAWPAACPLVREPYHTWCYQLLHFTTTISAVFMRFQDLIITLKL